MQKPQPSLGIFFPAPRVQQHKHLSIPSVFKTLWWLAFHPWERGKPRLDILISYQLIWVSSCCSVAKSCPTLCNLMDCSTLGLPVLHYLPEFAQTQVHWVGDAIQSSHPRSPPLPLAPNLSQHQGLFQRAGFLHQMAKGLEVQLQHQSSNSGLIAFGTD